MSFLSCIGKKSKRKKVAKNEPLDNPESSRSNGTRKGTTDEIYGTTDEIGSNKSNSSRKSNSSHKSTSSLSKKRQCIDKEGIQASNERLQAELDMLSIENKMYKSQLDQDEHNIASYLEEIQRLETNNIALKTRVTIADTEAAKCVIENQKLLQKIVGMEENQAMMSRAELHSMIAQLEEAELKASFKPATELSGIRTNPAEIMSRKKAISSQEDRQISWRLSKTEARLSQSEDENKKLREDLKDMLDSNTELQQIIVSDDNETFPVTQIQITSCNRQASVSLESETDDSDIDIASTTLNERLENAERDQSRLQLEYDNIEQSFKDILSRLDVYEENISKVEPDIRLPHDIPNDSEMVLANIQELDQEQQDIKASMAYLENVCEQLNKRIDVLCTENAQAKTLNDNLTTQNKDQKNELEKRVKEIETLRNEFNMSKDENKRLSDEITKQSQQLQKRKDTGSKNIEEFSDLEKDFADLRQKYEDANRRLKECATPKLGQPTKSLDLHLTTPVTLAERFRHELYEQHWKQAFDRMTKKLRRDEKKTIQILGEICTEAYLFCKRAARNQMETVASSLVSPTANNYRSNQLNKRNPSIKSLVDKLPEDLKRRLVHYRCRPTEDVLNSGVTDFLNQIDYDRTRFLRHVSERDFSEIMKYISTCFEMAWCMSVQDPPMYLLFKVKHGFEIESDKFDRYQSRGKRVDYVIWPAVFAEEGGACLQRGVIHALPDRV